MSPPTERTAPRRVLIVKPSALGDVVTALPVLHGLRRTFPEVEIDWIVRDMYAPLLADQPGLRRVVTYDRKLLGSFWRPGAGSEHLRDLKRTLREAEYDWAIDLQGLFRSAMFVRWTRADLRAGFRDARELAPLFYTHRIEAPVGQHTVDRNLQLARALGVDARPGDLTLSVSQEARTRAHRLLDGAGLPRDGFLAIVPPTRWETKKYPVRRWREMLSELPGDLSVAVLGNKGREQELCSRVAEGMDSAVSLAGQTDLPSLAAMLASAGAVVCCDSAAKFIAQAVGTPVVVLIGPTISERTGHYPKSPAGGVSISADLPCRHCLKKVCLHGTCMDLIPPGQVASEAIKALESTAATPAESPFQPGS
ncbi:MAG: glycosyltransferase family 9 protein [Phycisphaerae bacterium]